MNTNLNKKAFTSKEGTSFKLSPELDSLLGSKNFKAVNIIIYKFVQFASRVRTRSTNDLKDSNYKAEDEKEKEEWEDSGSEDEGCPEMAAEQTPNPNTGLDPKGPNARAAPKILANEARGGHEHKQPSRAVSDPGPHKMQEVMNAACISGVHCGKAAALSTNCQEFLTTFSKATKRTLPVDGAMFAKKPHNPNKTQKVKQVL